MQYASWVKPNRLQKILAAIVNVRSPRCVADRVIPKKNYNVVHQEGVGSSCSTVNVTTDVVLDINFLIDVQI